MTFLGNYRDMTMINCFFISLFLCFIIPAVRSGLIPNNRVIVHSDSTQNFDLVEGIKYRVVHFKSGLSLDSNGDKVYLTGSNDSPNQCWSLRKAKGDDRYTYNIINVGSGTNLDSGGAYNDDKRGVYLSNPKYNTITNPFQYWTFEKTKNMNPGVLEKGIKKKVNTYNIVHVNESRCLDSDGQNVYTRP